MRLVAQFGQRLKQDPRLQRMVHGGLSSFLVRGVAMLISLVTLPITVRYLGTLEYGVWVTVSTSVVMLSVLDLGIAATLTNFISESYAADDRAAAQGYFSTAFWITVGVSLLLGGVCAMAWPWIHWGGLLHLSDPSLIHQASTCVAISIVFLLIGLPLNLANRVLSGYQQVHLANYFQIVNSVLGLVAVISTVLLRGDLIDLMLTYCAAMLTGSVLLNLWLALHHKPWIRPHPGKVQRAMIRRLFGQGILFFIVQLTTLVVFNSDNLVITHYMGAANVTPYSVAWRLVNYACLLQLLLVPSSWPAFTEAYVKRDLDWVRSTYHSLERKTLLAVTCGAALIGLGGRFFIRIWAGPSAVPPSSLLWTMGLWAIVSCITTNQAMLLTAASRLGLLATVAVLAAIANLGSSIILVQRIGSEGVILSTVLSFGIFMVVPQGWEVRRALKGLFLPPLPRAAAQEAVQSLSPALHEEA
jgi:O-antigen/teichoic acid export membrane protein